MTDPAASGRASAARDDSRRSGGFAESFRRGRGDALPPGPRGSNPRRRPSLPSVLSGSAILALLAAGAVASQAKAADLRTAIGEKTLKRSRDVVILNSDKLGGFLDGDAPGAVSLLACSAEGFREIPFQIDPLGKDGLVIPAYVNRSREKGVYAYAPNPDRPERISHPFLLLFMASDAGRRHTGPTPPPGSEAVREICLQDPVDKGLAWVYLVRRERLQPGDLRDAASARSPAGDYVSYVLVDRGGVKTEEVRNAGVTIGFPDREKPYASGDWIVPSSAGGSGTDIMYTVRIRVKLRFLLFPFELDPNDSILPRVTGYNDGPIRVTRRVRSSIVFKGIKMDRVMGKARVETESHYYRDFAYFDGEVALPGFLKKLTQIDAAFTTDFVKQAAGILWYNSVNGAGSGCLVDGRMSPQEDHLVRDPYLWSLLVGPQGGWGNLLRVHTESVRPNMRLAYLDDSAHRDEKDPHLEGAWGSTGFRLNRLDRIGERVSWRSYVYAIPSTFQVSDMEGLVNLVFRPLDAAVDRTWPE